MRFKGRSSVRCRPYRTPYLLGEEHYVRSIWFMTTFIQQIGQCSVCVRMGFFVFVSECVCVCVCVSLCVREWDFSVCVYVYPELWLAEGVTVP